MTNHNADKAAKTNRYKFRGQDIDTKQWHYGYASFIDNDAYISVVESVLVELETNTIENILSQFEVIPETVGQFTGLRDKEGVEIYEGDVIYQGENKDCWFAHRVVEFINGSWCGKADNSSTYIRIYVELDKYDYQIEVSNNGWVITGNIHE